MASTGKKVAVIERALKIIAPEPARRQKCECDIAEALRRVEIAAKIDKDKLLPTPAQRINFLQQLSKTLETAIKLARKAIPGRFQNRVSDGVSWIEDLKRHRKEIEEAVILISKHDLRKGSRRFSYARITAVEQAYLLLKMYGKRSTLYRAGDWHELAKVLFRNEQADLFDYIERSSGGLRRLIVG